jgi:hypothetical protein
MLEAGSSSPEYGEVSPGSIREYAEEPNIKDAAHR